MPEPPTLLLCSNQSVSRTWLYEQCIVISTLSYRTSVAYMRYEESWLMMAIFQMNLVSYVSQRRQTDDLGRDVNIET